MRWLIAVTLLALAPALADAPGVAPAIPGSWAVRRLRCRGAAARGSSSAPRWPWPARWSCRR